MRCDEIQERFIDLLYNNEEGATPPSPELREHLLSCSACRKELEELKKTRNVLGLWKDEPPLKSITIARHEGAWRHFRLGWRHLRYAAAAAMVIMTLLAIANTQITWNRSGFSFSTHLFAGRGADGDYYNKAEVRNLVKRALDDSEFRTNETSYLMIQKMLDTVEQDRWMDLGLIRSRSLRERNKN